jgi:hypothetical protein
MHVYTFYKVFCFLFALKDIAFVADDTSIVSKILMMLYIAGVSHGLLILEYRIFSLADHLQEPT